MSALAPSNPGLLKRLAGFGQASGSAGVPHFGYGRHVVAPILFTAAVGGGAFCWALLRDEDQHAARSDRQHMGGGGEGLAELRQAAAAHGRHNWADSLPLLLRPGAHWWASFAEPTRTLAALVAVNAAVALLWRLPLLQGLMARNFTHLPGSGRSRTLLTSVFSHRGALHLTFNMFALWSFGHVAGRELGRDQFLAFYVTAGVVASLASHLATVWPLIGRGIPAPTLLARVQAIRPSLGASGAVIALFALVAARQPDRQVALIFAPDYPFSIGTGFKGMVGFDLAGVVARWRLFDHVAHLGGAGFGAWYARWGEGALWHADGPRRAALAARQEWRRLGDDGKSGSPPRG